MTGTRWFQAGHAGQLGEGVPDEYRAAIDDLGLEMLFGEDQALRTLFVTPTPVSGGTPLSALADSVQLFDSPSSVEDFAANEEVPVSSGSADFLGEERAWVRLEYSSHHVHYEFRGGVIHLITLSCP